MIHLILDFDSTFIQDEGLDELLVLAFEGAPDAARLEARLRAITDAGMDGTIPFSRSLAERVALLTGHPDRSPARRPPSFQGRGATRHLVSTLAQRLAARVTPSFVRNREALSRMAAEGRVHVVSSGFQDLIVPVVEPYAIPPERVLANRFLYAADGRIEGVDPSLPLSRDGGKVEALRGLKLEGTVVAVGDGITDLELKREGAAHRFLAFTENRRRDRVVAGADAEARSLEEVFRWLERWK